MSNIDYPFNFVPDAPGNANQVDSNFNAVSFVVNGQLDSNNFKSSAGITLGQLGLAGLAFNHATTGTTTWASGLTTDVQPRVAMVSDNGIQWGLGGGSTPDTELIHTAANTIQINDTVGGPGNLDLNGGMVLNANLGFTSLAIPGTFASGSLGTGGQLTLYGSTSGKAVIRVRPNAGTTNFRLPISNGSAGQGLVTDGAGNLSWANIGSGRQVLGPFTLPTNNSQTLTHSLGAVPRRAAILLTCVIPDNGYVAGNNAYFSGDASFQVGIYLQNLKTSQISIGTNASTFVGNRAIAPSSWQYLLYLFA